MDVILKSALILCLPLVGTCSPTSLLVLSFRFQCMTLLQLFQPQISPILWLHLTSGGLVPLKQSSPFYPTFEVSHASTSRRGYKTLRLLLFVGLFNALICQLY